MVSMLLQAQQRLLQRHLRRLSGAVPVLWRALWRVLRRAHGRDLG